MLSAPGQAFCCMCLGRPDDPSAACLMACVACLREGGASESASSFCSSCFPTHFGCTHRGPGKRPSSGGSSSGSSDPGSPPSSLGLRLGGTSPTPSPIYLGPGGHAAQRQHGARARGSADGGRQQQHQQHQQHHRGRR